MKEAPRAKPSSDTTAWRRLPSHPEPRCKASLALSLSAPQALWMHTLRMRTCSCLPCLAAMRLTPLEQALLVTLQRMQVRLERMPHPRRLHGLGHVRQRAGCLRAGDAQRAQQAGPAIQVRLMAGSAAYSRQPSLSASSTWAVKAAQQSTSRRLPAQQRELPPLAHRPPPSS